MVKISKPITPSDNTSDLIPNGWYTATVEPMELKSGQKGGNYFFGLLTITGPEYAGRKILLSFTNENANPDAVEIGRRQLFRLAAAAGCPKLDDTDQLIGCNVQVKVGVQKSKDERYEDSNVATDFKPIGVMHSRGTAPAKPVQETLKMPADAPNWAKG